MPAHELNFPILKKLQLDHFKCINVMNTDQTLVADLIPMDAGFNEVHKKNILVPNRGLNAELEATVHATATSSQATKNTSN